MPLIGSRHFTPRELSWTAAIVAVLAIVSALAIRSYSQYLFRARIVDGLAKLVAMRTEMERYFTKHLTYNDPAEPPCGSGGGSIAALPSDANFEFTCPVLTRTQFNIVATGTGALAGFQYSIDQNDNRFTVHVPERWAGAGSSCWVLRPDGTC